MTAYVSVASKAASFALLVRFLLAVFPPAELLPSGTSYADLWVPVVVMLSIVTMTLGNVLALYQKNIKRMLAYSSIAQAGYTLMGVAAISTTEGGAGASAVAYYMFMYVLTNILAFGCVIVFTNATGSENIADMAGLGRRNRWLAIFMAVALLSLAGIPPAAGFWGKFYLFLATVDAGLVALAVIAFLNSIVALYYYLVVIKVMFFDGDKSDESEIAWSGTYRFALALTAFGVVAMGTVAIQAFLGWADEAGLNLFIRIG
jgi:NADH:ubiquinone oxidoreductase subunit 2 (subunit N)